MPNNINLGALVSAYISENKISKTALARALDISPSNLESRLKKSFMRTDILLKICTALHHNFFADIAAALPAEFSVSAKPDNTKSDTIAALELEVKMLQRERDTLSGIISGKMGLQ
ncbi:MAG: helix-turn-helix transcriptional regulator [Flavobacterium sp.]|nr:helix-turn-helix transcriptional regulator [Flavobacterium sp.]